MDWNQILTILVGALVTAILTVLPPLALMFLKWLQNQAWVKKLHLEDFFGAMVPQAVQWVEYWAEQLVKKGEAKPTGEAKMAKFVEYLRTNAPDNLKGLTDSDIALRAETELKKLKEGLK